MQLFVLSLFVLFGFGLAKAFGLNDLESSDWYMLAVAILLAVGLYASTYGIDLREARKHLKIILAAVTVGVLLKAAIIGGSLALIFQDPFFLILGVAVAQIDPLSVANLMKGNRMSKKAKTILASWASFDDPVTVILALYVPLLVMQLTGIELGSITGDKNINANLVTYIQELGLNLGLAAQAFCLYTVLRFYAKQISAWSAFGVSLAVYVLLALTFSVSVLYFMMLGIALIGLFLRPPKFDRFIGRVITWALWAAAVLLGALLIGGLDIGKGVALGIAAYVSQIIVGYLLTRGLPKKDRLHIAFAQQNGITAIILALLFEPIRPGTVAIVAPAILTANILHNLINREIDKHWLK
jgi:NhaP-type Na+/H+ or K+/H+ antiporter